jgi:hypothetical protein
MLNIRTKFEVVHNAEVGAYSTMRAIALEPRYDTSIEEDARFSKATPSGSLQMLVDNPDALEMLSIGATFYVTLTPIEEQK